jgi:phenylpropionate dioxygenase-like ring-hydroxylating dioxygenase large terminal subunit
MITREENDLLTRIGPGTPCGNLLRRYWQPVALAEELPPGGAPRAVKLMGEALALFRDDQGRPGLLGLHCSHRGTDLSYGRVEDGGLRCLYHGWLYDIRGRVIEQPGEPGGGAHRGEICHLAYPCQEAGGIVFAYLGPGEPPLLPNYEFLGVPEAYRTATKVLIHCNYLQGNEGNIDPVHLSFLHQSLAGSDIPRRRVVLGSENESDNALLGKDIAPRIEVEVTDFGLRIYTTRDAAPGKCYLRITNLIFPNASAFGGSTIGEGYSVHWHVPIDDHTHWKYIFMFSREQPLADNLRNWSKVEQNADYSLTRIAANRYQQDRASMKDQTFTGMGLNFQAHDAFATESQGAIQDRTAENPVSSDKAIIAERKLILSAIKDIQEGREPRNIIRDPKANRFADLVVLSEVVSADVDGKAYMRQVAAENQASPQNVK